MHLTEKQLISRLKNGEQESFSVLFEKYSGRIYGLAFRMCGNKEDADDIVQNTFIQAFTNINSFREESGIYTWLYTIAKNISLQLLGHKKKSAFLSLEKLVLSEGSQILKDDLTTAEKRYYINQVREGCLLGLIRCLSFYQRVAFILNVLLDVNVMDVSSVIGKSETATRLLVHRAKQNIKGFLCKNCFLYNSENPCRCENLIDFSLKQGWIKKIRNNETSPQPLIRASAIEKEISDINKIIMLYSSLEDPQPSENIIHIIQNEISKSSYKIFSSKKVK